MPDPDKTVTVGADMVFEGKALGLEKADRKRPLFVEFWRRDDQRRQVGFVRL